jgi:hypothetical protein
LLLDGIQGGIADFADTKCFSENGLNLRWGHRGNNCQRVNEGLKESSPKVGGDR